MFKRPVLKFSSGAKLIAFAVVAVMLPTTVLSVIQYRSLVDLESKTKVAVQDSMRRTLQRVAREVEMDFRGLVKKSFDIKMEDLKNLDRIENHCAEIRKSYPQVGKMFVVSEPPSCPAKEFAIFCSVEGIIRIEQAQFNKNPMVRQMKEIYSSAWMMQHSETMKPDIFFWQFTCKSCSINESPHSHHYVFYPRFEKGNKGYKEPAGFAGMSLDDDYIRSEFFARIMPEMLGNPDIRIDGSDSVLAIFDEYKRELYASQPWLREPEVVIGFGPVFPRWRLAIGYKDKTIESLARDNFQKSLMITLFVLSLLIVGIILTLRATAREMRLAQAKSTFVSNVSHELKTPLALIRLFAETLELGRVKSDEKAHEYYRIINNESRRLTQLINNILDFSKIEANRKEYNMVSSDVAEVIEDVIRSYEYQITNAGFELDTDIEAGLPPALIDRDALSQAVLNLLNNAVKYSEDIKKIAVRVGARDHHIAIEVADSGIGIPRSEQKKIFEKFYRVSAGLVHDTKGSGLGLALVKHIVEAHRGQILVESAPGKGSRFTILLPASETDRAADGVGFDRGGYTVAEGANN
ncbi:MAG: HAMP domain-containing histidine kinase [Blastocatellia bacterium]|nr:HAMP domain-containing histidine kinase [Blastocatellia bacterium]